MYCYTQQKKMWLLTNSHPHLTFLTTLPLRLLCGFCNNTLNSCFSDLQCSLGAHILPVNLLRPLCFHSRTPLFSSQLFPTLDNFTHIYCFNYLFKVFHRPRLLLKTSRFIFPFSLLLPLLPFKTYHQNASPIYPTELPKLQPTQPLKEHVF